MSLCLTPADCAMEIADTFWSSTADQLRAAAGAVLTDLFAWWTRTGATAVDQPVLRTASTFVLTWIAFPIALLALLATVGWGLLGGTAEWVRNAVRGSLVFGAAAAISVVMVAALQDWSESLAAGVLDAVPTESLGGRFVDVLTLPGVSPAQVAFWSSLMLLVGAVQWLLMLFRDAAVLVLTVMLPLAAAGQFAQASRGWLPKVAGWLLAFIFFKPAAAIIYWLGLSLLGETADVQTLAVALVVLVSATVALPALLRLVTFAVDGLPDGQRGLSSVATVVGIAATAAQLVATRGASAAAGAPGSPGASGPTGAPAAVGARSLAGASAAPAGSGPTTTPVSTGTASNSSSPLSSTSTPPTGTSGGRP